MQHVYNALKFNIPLRKAFKKEFLTLNNSNHIDFEISYLSRRYGKQNLKMYEGRSIKHKTNTHTYFDFLITIYVTKNTNSLLF